MIREFIALRDDIEALKTAVGGAMEVGAVSVVDPVKGYRLKLGDEDGGPYLSAWYPHPETGKTSVPLKVGQIVGVMNPTGDPRQGFLLRGGYSGDHASPNDDMAANVFEDAGVRVEIAGGQLLVTIGGMTHALTGEGIQTIVDGVRHGVTGDGVATEGGAISHDGANIGATHVHGGVVRGGADTFGPH